MHVRSWLPVALVYLAAGCASPYESSSTNVDEASVEALREALQPYRLPDEDDLDALPQDPRNPLTREKVSLGRLLFHDAALHVGTELVEARATASCATCHHAVSGFQAGTRQGLGEGAEGFAAVRTLLAGFPSGAVDAQAIRTPSALNAAWFENVLWNGQFGATGANVGTDSSWLAGTPKAANQLGFHGLETQAIAGQDVHRVSIDASGIATDPQYVTLFAEAFPDVAEGQRVSRVHAGLAIAAYERTLLANRAPFQRWLRGDSGALTQTQLKGARLFFGRAGCVACHNNPGLGGSSFHALGMPDFEPGMPNVKPDSVEKLGRGGFTGRESERFAFKVPQLYNLSDSPFLGHGGSFHSVRDVIQYKNDAISANPLVEYARLSPRFVPLELSPESLDALVDFVEHGLSDPDLARYEPRQDELPFQTCVPNADAVSWAQLGCSGSPPAAPAPLSGVALENHEVTDQRFALPPIVLAPGGVLVVARNATREEFEAAWGALAPWVMFVSASAVSSGAPIINGGELFYLVAEDGTELDGPCVSAAGAVNQRVGPNQWKVVGKASATPGKVPVGLDGLGLAVTEVADVKDSLGSRFEFVEISYLP
ncbi:MAG: cytochrome-c peroxidase [Deltaproteobacteria bacterium]|nr:cytochrome-c peroxidase [Deltaproteobacteria bacterium]